MVVASNRIVSAEMLLHIVEINACMKSDAFPPGAYHYEKGFSGMRTGPACIRHTCVKQQGSRPGSHMLCSKRYNGVLFCDDAYLSSDNYYARGSTAPQFMSG